MNNTILSAEEWLANQQNTCDLHGNLKDGLFTNDVIKFMKQYAQAHCEAQLKAILENAKIVNISKWTNDKCIDKDSIINAYNLEENIK